MLPTTLCTTMFSATLVAHTVRTRFTSQPVRPCTVLKASSAVSTQHVPIPKALTTVPLFCFTADQAHLIRSAHYTSNHCLC